MAKKSLAETHPELIKEWHPTLNGSLTPNDVTYDDSTTNIWWFCDKGKWPDGTPSNDHIWETKISNRTNKTLGRVKSGCACCDNKKVVPSNCLATTHPQIAKQWHPTLNGNLTPNDVVVGSGKKAWFFCDKGKWPDGTPSNDHIFQQTIRDSLKNGCPCCSNKKVVPSNCLATTHPQVAEQWHPTLNGNLTPNDFAAMSGKKAWFFCDKGKWPDGTPSNDHIWDAVIASVSKGHGCACCNNKRVVPSNCLATTHPQVAEQWHPTLNGNLTPNDVIALSHKKAWFFCDKGKWPDGTVANDHVWKTNIASVSKGHGCPCCTNLKVVPSNCLATTHPQVAEQWHPTLNGNLTPNDVVIGTDKKVWFLCDKGHAWKTRIVVRKKCNCIFCNESKGEKAVSDHLESLGFIKSKDFICQYITRTDRPDFIMPKLKCFIEFNGKQHYIPVDFGSKKKYAALHNLAGNIRRDNGKLQRSVTKGWPLLIIPYWDIFRIPEIIDDMLVGKTPTFSEPPEIVKKYEPIRKKIRDRLKIKGPEVLCGLIK
jgi:G:T-mismatch repair DNA endonuclease (very short patch repair protein)/uncharacterized protein YeaC (DUF1315 family)